MENVGCYRLMVKGPNRIGIQTVPQHDISVQLAHAEARHARANVRGEDLPVAITVSNEPIVMLMAATPLLYNQLEYKMAAVMQGKPYRVVKTAKGLDIPYPLFSTISVLRDILRKPRKSDFLKLRIWGSGVRISPSAPSITVECVLRCSRSSIENGASRQLVFQIDLAGAQ